MTIKSQFQPLSTNPSSGDFNHRICKHFLLHNIFLEAKLFFKPLCPSVGLLVGRSVGVQLAYWAVFSQNYWTYLNENWHSYSSYILDANCIYLTTDMRSASTGVPDHTCFSRESIWTWSWMGVSVPIIYSL